MHTDEWCGLPASHWWRIVPPLSADLVWEFYDDLGLFFTTAEGLQPVLRDTILRHRPVFHGWLNGDTDEQALLHAVSGLGGDLRRHVGGDMAELFRLWCKEVFTIEAEDNVDWFCYENAFKEWALEWRRNGADTFRLGASLVERYQTIVNGKQVHERFRQNAKRPLSEWDQLLFSITRYTQRDDWGEGETNLYDAIFQTINRNRFQIFWEMSRGLLTAEAAANIYLAAENTRKHFANNNWIDEGSVIEPARLRRTLPVPPAE